MARLKRLSFLVLFFLVSGCGGDGDGSLSRTETPTGGESDAATISLSISNVNVTEQTPATITAVVQKSGSALTGEVVTFSSSLGQFLPVSGTALTDSNGAATIVLNAGEIAGAGVIVAKISSGEENGIGFTTQGTNDAVVSLGSGDPFLDSVAEISLSEISAGGTMVVSVSLVDENGDLYTEPVDIDFSSTCSQSSETNALASLDSPVTTFNGTATSTYLAAGCVGVDDISVSAVVNEVSLTAQGAVNVLGAEVGSIEFESATPEQINIKGTGALGGSESAKVVFRVLDTNGNPVSNKVVNFSLNSTVGGLSVDPVSATTNSEGIVETNVKSGTVATSVRVEAITSVDGTTDITSQSSLLVVSTGIPDQDSFSLSADILNPEAWNIDGSEVQVTARLADAFNNPVPNGTAVSFTTEGGSIGSSCVTTDGVCSVTWISQQPRPEGHIIGDVNNLTHLAESTNTMGQKYGGRVSIVATAIGEESFPDLNGNGRFDESEAAMFAGNDVSGQPYDRKEAYADYNEDNFYNPGEVDASEQAGGDLEEFLDFNDNGSFDANDGLYNGVLCAEPAHAGCAVNDKSINVRGEIVLVMSGSYANFVTTSPANGANIEIIGDGTGTATVIVADLHNQPMPYGTVVEFKSTVGSIVAGSPVTWGNDNHNGGGAFSVVVKGETDPKEGDLIVTVTTLSGASSLYTVAHIVIR